MNARLNIDASDKGMAEALYNQLFSKNACPTTL